MHPPTEGYSSALPSLASVLGTCPLSKVAWIQGEQGEQEEEESKYEASRASLSSGTRLGAVVSDCFPRGG